jgi:hypothetical protein
MWQCAVSRARRLNLMGILQQFKLVVRENEFIELAKSKDGTISWFIKASASMRLCIDVLTSSATVFWTSGPSKLSSKTFRTVPSLKDWFALPVERQLQTMERLK